MKHRKDWTAWKKKREAQLRTSRETNQIILKMLREQIDSMHTDNGLIARLMRPKPMTLFGGKKMQCPIIYGRKP